MNWVVLDAAQVLKDFPTDLKPYYDKWVAEHPDKAGRLAEITQRTVAEFRDAIASNPANQLDPDTTKVPESCLRSAETIVLFNLMMEMGQSIKEEAQESMTRAEIFLRQIGYKHFLTTADATGGPTPLYVVLAEHAPRALPCIG